MKRLSSFFTVGLFLASCQQQDLSTSPKPETVAPQQKAAPLPPPPPVKAPKNPGFVGMDADQALAKAKELGLRARVIEIDGVGQPVTKDYRPERFGFLIKNGKVVGFRKG